MRKTHFAILDRNIGFLQWLGEYPTAEAALADFGATVGIDPDGAGLSLDDWRIYHLTAEEAAAVERWAQDGHPANECPTCVTDKITESLEPHAPRSHL